jgi:hypothetical protein
MNQIDILANKTDNKVMGISSNQRQSYLINLNQLKQVHTQNPNQFNFNNLVTELGFLNDSEFYSLVTLVDNKKQILLNNYSGFLGMTLAQKESLIDEAIEVYSDSEENLVRNGIDRCVRRAFRRYRRRIRQSGGGLATASIAQQFAGEVIDCIN